MKLQFVTPELRQWIVEQGRAGRSRDELLAAMRSSGWRTEVAAEALDVVLQPVAGTPQALAEARATGPAGAAIRLPQPELGDSPSRLDAGDRQVAVLMSMRSPRVVVLGGLLSDAECDELVAVATPRLSRSETVVYDTGGSEVHAARTSRGMFFRRAETALCERIERRIAALLRWPVENGEGLQVLHYGPGAEYKPHHDYFDPARPGMASVLARGGQRLATVVIYLNTPERGGGTVFPDIGLEVAPVKGNAVFFSYDRPDPLTRTLHGGAPVLRGEKWVATKWLREREFV